MVLGILYDLMKETKTIQIRVKSSQNPGDMFEWWSGYQRGAVFPWESQHQIPWNLSLAQFSLNQCLQMKITPVKSRHLEFFPRWLLHPSAFLRLPSPHQKQPWSSKKSNIPSLLDARNYKGWKSDGRVVHHPDYPVIFWMIICIIN